MHLGAAARSALQRIRAMLSARIGTSHQLSNAEQSVVDREIADQTAADRRRIERSQFDDDAEYFEVLVQRAIDATRP